MTEIFWEEDAKIILALPVHEGRENFLAWHFDKHGRFSVKSAYKVCRSDIMRERSRGGAQGGSRTEPDVIWKIDLEIKSPK